MIYWNWLVYFFAERFWGDIGSVVGVMGWNVVVGIIRQTIFVGTTHRNVVVGTGHALTLRRPVPTSPCPYRALPLPCPVLTFPCLTSHALTKITALPHSFQKKYFHEIVSPPGNIQSSLICAHFKKKFDPAFLRDIKTIPPFGTAWLSVKVSNCFAYQSGTNP